jgi:hypothetical protein
MTKYVVTEIGNRTNAIRYQRTFDDYESAKKAATRRPRINFVNIQAVAEAKRKRKPKVEKVA